MHYDFNSGCHFVSEESSSKKPPANKTLTNETSICSATTVHAAPNYTTITVASTYTSSCPSARLDELTAPATLTCTGDPDVPTTDQIVINKTCIKTSVEYLTETLTKTVVLTSMLPSSLKRMSAFLVTALPTSVDDIGYVETAKYTRF